jgi:UDP-N-acetylmuramate dehydrogenase
MGLSVAQTRALSDLTSGKVVEGAPLAPYTTFKVGGPAELLLEPANRQELVAVHRYLLREGVPYFVLGGGSNLLVSDKGIPGVVLRPSPGLRGIRFAGSEATAESGALLSRLVKMAAERGLDGLVGAAGIPGTVGGAIVMNAGTSGGEVSDRIVWVEISDASGEERRIPKQELRFAYRASRLQGSRALLLAAHFHLDPAPGKPLLDQVRAFCDRRKESQPLQMPNAGCVWRNPPSGPSAGQLIDEAGLKGLAVGGAQVSEQHANFIINRGGATAADVRALMERVGQVVKEHCGIELNPEIRLVGDWN